MAELSMRPNIRIEIHNNLVHAMDIDAEQNKEEEEEGEISDVNDIDTLKQKIIKPVPIQRTWTNSNGGFTTGINIFDKEEQLKLLDRAKRFALNVNDLNNFTDEQLQELHDSLGINLEEEKLVRFEAIHMRGIDEMSSEDVFEYFSKYGPSGIEWINDESCNVVWNDKISSTRALLFLSKPVKGMPVEGPCDPFVKELKFKEADNKENEGRSILLKNIDREVELQHDYSEDVSSDVHVSNITVPIPPGYWRLGLPHVKCKFILLRFAFKSDKKPLKAEKFSEYYKKYGNPNFGGMRGIITESRRQRFKGIFDRNRDIQRDKKIADNPKNPWGALAMNWDADACYREKAVECVPKPNNLTSGNAVSKSNIMKRLGFKRSHEVDLSTSEIIDTEKKTKVPRMRMYADEEEEKIKLKRQLLDLKTSKHIQRNNDVEDLRNIIQVVSKRKKVNVKIESEKNEEEIDLGTKLKNRSKKISSTKLDTDRHRDKINSAEKELSKKRYRENRNENSESKHSKDENYKRHKSPKNFEMRLHSDRQENIKRDDYFEEWINNHKPKSKIAVVIKTQKKPTVASTVWSRIHSERERLKTVSEGKLRVRRESTTSCESDTSTSESSSSDSTDSLDMEEDIEGHQNSDTVHKSQMIIGRPGFGEELPFSQKEYRSPLRIEISNDHFKKQ